MGFYQGIPFFCKFKNTTSNLYLYKMQKSILNNILYPEDLRQVSREKLPKLAIEIRKKIIDLVASKEGHLGASLGVIELTIALHYVFNTPEDIIVWDVGHQAYGHKILTGRKNKFHTNRQFNGISGFPKMSESIYDAFGTGHSSTSISAVLGMAVSSQLTKNFKRQHIAVIGDASIASGMAFEALNHAGVTNTNLLVILNDNAIGIDPSVGALKKYLLKVTLDQTPNTDNIFEALNFNYSGPIDGHNLNNLVDELNRLKKINGPKLLHIITKKGKGLKQAEENQVLYHAPGKFNAVTGEIQYKNEKDIPPKFQDVFGKTLVELATINKKIIGITPAMPTGSSLKYMMEIFPKRAFDVGIAEQHAVTFSAGMATQGNIVFCNIYSTFLQRAYDQLIHDVCLQNLPVIFCLDRAGLVGEDGATHHGIFDINYLRCIPNLIIFAPRNEVELRNIMYTAQLGLKKPIAIRYPRGRGKIISWRKPFSKIEIGKGLQLKKGNNIAVLTIGSVSNNVIDGINKCQDPKEVSCYDMRFIKPIDEVLLHRIFKKYNTIITLEDGIAMGGFGSAVNEFYIKNNYKKTLKNIGISDEFPDQGSIDQLQDIVGISAKKITQLLNDYL